MTQALSSKAISSDSWREVVRSMQSSEREQLSRLLTPKWTKYIRQEPYVQQTAFLLLPQTEALYGGAGGGGKSSALLMGGLQYVDVPGFSAIIFRRTFADLAKSGALMDRAKEWLTGTDAKWNEQKHQWRFPSGAVLAFGHLESEGDKYAHQGAEYQYIGFDELTHFTLTQYTYLRSRLRRLKKNAHVPLRVRCSANPGGVGHEWVYKRFFKNAAPKGKPRRVFIPAKLEDNLHLDKESYVESLEELDPVTYRQLRHGDWETKEAGEYFKRQWFEIVDQAPEGLRWIRYWDLAATAKSKKNPDPDYIVGLLIAEWEGQYWIKDVVRGRWSPAETEDRLLAQARIDGPEVPVHIEQEPGASAKLLLNSWEMGPLKGFAVYGHPQHNDKVTRAKPFSAAADPKGKTYGRVRLVRGDWNDPFLDELEGFPIGPHDDQVDAGAGGFAQVHIKGRGAREVEEMPEEIHYTGVGAERM